MELTAGPINFLIKQTLKPDNTESTLVHHAGLRMSLCTSDFLLRKILFVVSVLPDSDTLQELPHAPRGYLNAGSASFHLTSWLLKRMLLPKALPVLLQTTRWHEHHIKHLSSIYSGQFPIHCQASYLQTRCFTSHTFCNRLPNLIPLS